MIFPRKTAQGSSLSGIGLACACALSLALPMTGKGGALLQAQEVEAAPSDFDSFKQSLRRQAMAEGVSAETLDHVLPTVRFVPRVIALDRAQPGGVAGAIPEFAPYRARHVDAERIRRGKARAAALRILLQRIERESRVPADIMLAIYGHETNYGAFTGSFDLANALASLAYEGRRRTLFTREFIALMKVMDSGIPRSRLKGSWAGATGYPQFLPSVYLRVGRDGDGDGKADIWSSEADALASIAQYFKNAGWRPDIPWGVGAQVPNGFNWARVSSRLSSPFCGRVHGRHSQWKMVSEWRALGVLPTRPILKDTDMVSLFQPDGPGTPAWLLTGNYRVILDYNCSNFYALSVGLLADAVSMDDEVMPVLDGSSAVGVQPVEPRPQG